jgi:carbon-monoxide dehydrogenase medium subunit
VALDGEGRCAKARLALCGVGETPVDASDALSTLAGQACTDEAIEAACVKVQEMIAPSGNVHGTADYQRHIAGVLTQRVLAIAHQRAGHGA